MSNTLIPPVLVDTDINDILEWYTNYYQTATGTILQPGQVETLIIGAIANREVQNRALWQQVGIGQLVDFATAPILDYIVALVGVNRLLASPSQVDIQFSIISGSGAVTIPAGTRIQSSDGQATFETVTDVFIPAATPTVTITCQATISGSIANGYTSGNITFILDPQPFITAATNTDTSAGGADPETDDQLRARAKLANSSFSVAGSINAYKYWARTANALIIDVGVTNPVPGTANIYPLVANQNPTSSDILDQVRAILKPDNIRPLCDTVIVASPTAHTYSLTISITKLTGGVDAQIISDVEAALLPFSSNNISLLGVDIVANKIVSLIMEVANVYDVGLGGFTTISLSGDESKYCFCTGITVNITSSH